MRLFRPLATLLTESNAISRDMNNDRSLRDRTAWCFRMNLFAVTLLLFISAGVSRADFAISIGNATVDSGGSAIVDILISGSPNLSYYLAEFRIEPLGLATPGGLRFLDPQTVDIVGNSNYVFYNESAAFDRAVTMTFNPNDTLTLIDFTSNAAGTDVSNTKLLARLNLTALTGLTNGTQYQITAASSDFQDPLFNSVTVSSSGGLITIQNTAVEAVPLPGTLAAGLIGAGLLSLVGYRRRLQAR